MHGTAEQRLLRPGERAGESSVRTGSRLSLMQPTTFPRSEGRSLPRATR